MTKFYFVSNISDPQLPKIIYPSDDDGLLALYTYFTDSLDIANITNSTDFSTNWPIIDKIYSLLMNNQYEEVNEIIKPTNQKIYVVNTPYEIAINDEDYDFWDD